MAHNRDHHSPQLGRGVPYLCDSLIQENNGVFPGWMLPKCSSLFPQFKRCEVMLLVISLSLSLTATHTPTSFSLTLYICETCEMRSFVLQSFLIVVIDDKHKGKLDSMKSSLSRVLLSLSSQIIQSQREHQRRLVVVAEPLTLSGCLGGSVG